MVSLIINFWKSAGCPGITEAYICRPLALSYFLSGADGMNSFENDFTRLMDIKNFTFLMNNFPCNNSDLKLLVLVHSDTHNFDKRWTIRNTWGSFSDSRFKLLFLLGVPKNPLIQGRLDEENEMHKDLVQGSFVDTYRNLTYKHLMALKWTKYFCSKAKYLLKTDDDVFINIPEFLKHVDHVKHVMTLPEYNAPACRSWRSKWRVTYAEYKFRRYPTFCYGYSILYSMDVVLILYSLGQRAKYFWIDDVFVTGVLTLAAGITPTSFDKYILPRYNLFKVTDGNWEVFPYLLGPPNLKGIEIKKLWKKVKV